MKISFNFKRIIITVLILAGIFVAGRITFGLLPTRVISGESLQIGHVTRQTFGFNNMSLLVAGDGLMLVNRRGEVVWQIDERFSTPFVSVNRNHILHGSRRGQDAVVYRNRSEIYRINTDENIIFGVINQNGYAAIVTETPWANGMVTIYNRRGNEIYRLRVGDGHVVDVSLSPNNQILAVAKISAGDFAVYSTITFKDITRNEEIAVVRVDNSMVFAIQHNRDGSSVAVFDTEFIGFSSNGQEQFNVDFGGRTLSTFNLESENCFVFAFQSGRGNTTLEFYNRDGRLRGSYSAQGRIRNITVSGDVVLASRLRTILRITPTGRAEELVTVPHDIVDLQIMGDRRCVLVVGGATSRVVRF